MIIPEIVASLIPILYKYMDEFW